MSNFVVRKVAVLGAGVMGAQIAAHCVNARVPVVLFDLPAKEGPKNGIVLKAIENLRKLNPAPLGVKDDAQFIEAANYDDGLELLKGCDVIIEAIAERLDWKHDLYRKIGPFVAPNAILASNTSGLPIAKLAEAMDAGLKARFCGVHFFNPPRYMHLVELIATPATRPQIMDDLETFLTSTLGKGVVRAKDTPNFIANRVGIFGMLATIKEAAKYGIALRRRRRPDGHQARPRQERDLPHRGRRRPRHDGARDQDDAGHAAGVDRPVRRALRDAAGAEGAGGEGRAGPEGQAPASIARTARRSRSSTRRRPTTSIRPARPTSWSRAS